MLERETQQESRGQIEWRGEYARKVAIASLCTLSSVGWTIWEVERSALYTAILWSMIILSPFSKLLFLIRKLIKSVLSFLSTPFLWKTLGLFNLHIFRDQAQTLDFLLHWRRRKVRLIEGNAKCCHLKNLTCKATSRQVFICLRPRTPYPPPPPHTHTHTL